MNNKELIELAKKARLNAYVPISKFKVGSALLTKEGKVFLGCNVEDSSGIGVANICAERCAIIKAISEGYKDFKKIAVVAGEDDLIFTTPCRSMQAIYDYNGKRNKSSLFRWRRDKRN